MEACELAARAGGVELRAWRGRFATKEKGPADLVTDADVASQRAIQAVVAARFPDHIFLGEESETAVELPDHGICWVVDPLDGTTNYVHGYPAYAVSVAAVEGNNLLAGAIYDPLTDDCYGAARDGGAWLGGKRLSVSGAETLADALLAVSLPPRVTPESPDLRCFCDVAGRCRAIRRSGSCAMNLAHVAAGVLDGFWAHAIHPWDVAAGVLLVREAGGTVTAVDGSDFNLANANFAATATPNLHAQLLPQLLR
jgi:myo-inositol-1(or 4)-monophosphatase